MVRVDAGVKGTMLTPDRFKTLVLRFPVATAGGRSVDAVAVATWSKLVIFTYPVV
jgi:hypothetical protein